MAEQGKKKGLGTIAWVLIGCLGIVVLGVGTLTIGTVWLGKKAIDAAKDPVLLAETAVRMHPDYDLVDSDADDGTLRIRRASDNELFTVDVDEILENGLVIEGADGERIEFNPQAAQEGGALVTTTAADGSTGSVTMGEGGITFEGADGQTATIGKGATLPSWLPEFTGGEVTPGMASRKANGEIGGMLTIASDSALEDFSASLESQLEESGFTRTGLIEQPGIRVLTYESEGRTLQISLQATDAGGSQAGIAFNGPE